MSQREKLIAKMRNNPDGWDMETLLSLARHYGLKVRMNDGSHHIFVRQDGKTLPVPFKRPIKAIYVKKFLKLLEV